MNKQMKNSLIGLGAMLVLSAVVIAGSDPLYKALRGPITTATPVNPLTDGQYTYKSTTPDAGYLDVVTMTVEDGIITACNWDCLDENGNGKQMLSMKGEYIMTENGPTWKAQADELAKYVIENQKVDGLMDEHGYAKDAIASVSINVYGFVTGVEDCLAQASGIASEKPAETEAAETEAAESVPAETIVPAESVTLADGEYTFTGEPNKGYTDVVTITIKDGVITACNWDCMDENGNGKQQLSLEGKYVMTENGPTWKAQAEELAKYVIENQGVKGLANADGYAKDTIASVSINVFGFINGVEDCLRQAAEAALSSSAPVVLYDGEYSYKAAEPSKGYTDVVTMTIKDGAITACNWDCLDENGNGKQQLSLEGKYVMTENGPTWKAQAEELAKYVIENQGVKGLANADGYAKDAIASVSINVFGFINGVEDCLKQASVAPVVLYDGEYSFTGEPSKGYTDVVTMTIKDGAITACNWDCLDENGNGKQQLSLEGKYVMTENGPTWKAQAEELAKYVIENQGVKGLADANGYAKDAIASVSINVFGFINGVEDCLKQASAPKAASDLNDGEYSYKAAEPSKGYTDVVTMTIKNGAITACNWDCLDENGNGKQQLSMEGKYVMTENGPTWKAQAEELAKYVIENQGVKGLADANGYAKDAIASVSINVFGFINGVEDCLKQAAK